MAIMLLKGNTRLTGNEFENGGRKKQAFNKLLIPRKQKEANENVKMEQEESHSVKHWINLFSNGSTRDVQKDFLYQGNSS